MSTEPLTVTEPLLRYLRAVSVREPEVLKRLREETRREQEHAGMQITPEQGRLLAVLVRIMGARKALEIGVFTGYSSLSMVLAMPQDALLVACDVSEEYTDVARRYSREAGVEDRVEFRLGPAVETLDQLLGEGHGASFDLAFIDADKPSYLEYYERSLELVRTGGLVAVDNTLWNGRVIDPEDESPETEAIREINEHVYMDERVEQCMLAVGDGLTLAVKR